jgi:hypothetical protein
MFTKNSDVVNAMRLRRAVAEKPEAGLILSGLRNLPVRIHCQIMRGKASEIFAYATMVPLMPELSAEGQHWFLRDYASVDLAGTKMILNSRSRDLLLDLYADHPILSCVDVLPVTSIKVIRPAASGKSFEVEIEEHVKDEALELCAQYAKIALDSDEVATEKARQDFYAAFREA